MAVAPAVVAEQVVRARVAHARWLAGGGEHRERSRVVRLVVREGLRLTDRRDEVERRQLGLVKGVVTRGGPAEGASDDDGEDEAAGVVVRGGTKDFIDIDVDAIVEEVLAGLEEGAEVLQDSDIGKIVAKALNGIDAEVKIEVSVDTSESSPDSP